MSFAEGSFYGSEVVQGLVPVPDEPLPLDLDANALTLALRRQLGDGPLELVQDVAVTNIHKV